MSEIVTEGIIQKDVLQQFVDTVSALVDECRIHFSESGLSAAAVDPANVAMIDASLSSTAFESYDAPGQVRIGVNLNNLDEKINSANADDLIEFAVDMETRHLTLRYRSISHEMALIDPDAIRSEPDTPDLELPNYVEIESDDLREAAENIDLITDHVYLSGDETAGDSQFIVYGEGDTDLSEGRYDTDDLTRIEIGEDAESLFGMPYVLDLTDPIPSGVDIGIAFGDEYPTEWQWAAFDEALDVKASLAPRIQSD
jgi:proliferating cell nuclear antigen